MTDIFVFGSNLLGEHVGGAAAHAHRHYGAQWGRCFGLFGSSFAIPTVYKPGPNSLPLDVIGECVRMFAEFAAEYPELTYKVTALGTGVAGYSHEEIANQFRDCGTNVHFPRPWHAILFGGHRPERESFAE